MISPVTQAEDTAMEKTIAIVDKLLEHTIPLRDFYQSARCQTVPSIFRICV
jgi:hypothetical protein